MPTSGKDKDKTNFADLLQSDSSSEIKRKKRHARKHRPDTTKLAKENPSEASFAPKYVNFD